MLNREDADSCAVSDHKSCSDLGECKAALGTAATRAADCASGFLTDGVCCATAQCGLCEACIPQLKETNELPGICSAAKSGSDLREECPTEAPASCGRTGTCDGRRQCALYTEATACGPTSVCSGVGTCITKEGACDGDHTIIDATGKAFSCGSFKCEGARCKLVCHTRTDCIDGYDCTADGRCVEFAGTSPAANDGCRTSREPSPPGAPFVLLSLALWGVKLTARVGRRSRSVGAESARVECALAGSTPLAKRIGAVLSSPGGSLWSAGRALPIVTGCAHSRKRALAQRARLREDFS